MEEDNAAMENQSNGNRATNGTSSTENGGRKRELAVYEQFRDQVIFICINKFILVFCIC